MVVHIPMVSTLQVPLLVCILQKMRSTHTHNNMLTKKGGGEKGGRRDAWKKKSAVMAKT